MFRLFVALFRSHSIQLLPCNQITVLYNWFCLWREKKEYFLSNANNFPTIVDIVAVQLLRSQQFPQFSASFISGHSDDDFYLIISIFFSFLCFASCLHFSFYHQRTNINASTCKSAYEWGFSLHRYDLIKFKYL